MRNPRDLRKFERCKVRSTVDDELLLVVQPCDKRDGGLLRAMAVKIIEIVVLRPRFGLAERRPGLSPSGWLKVLASLKAGERIR